MKVINKIKSILEASKKHYPIVIALLYFTIISMLSIFFRFVSHSASDETLYLKGVTDIYYSIVNLESLKDPIASGWHGFLFKLFPAILFTLAGPNIYVATLFNLLIASMTVYLSFHIFKKYLDSYSWSATATIFFITTYRMIFEAPTFARDIPAVFAIVLLIYLISYNKSLWMVGISLLLILNSKSYVFFLTLPPLLLWVFFSIDYRINTFKYYLELLKSNLKIILPSVVWFYLMFGTTIIPYDYSLASVIGLNSTSNNYLSRVIRMARPEFATRDMHAEQKFLTKTDMKKPDIKKPDIKKPDMKKPDIKKPDMKKTDMKKPDVKKTDVKKTDVKKTEDKETNKKVPKNTIFNYLMAYFHKLASHRTFTFISIPFVFVALSVVSVIAFWRRIISDKSLLFISFYLIFNLLVYIFLNSYGRYLMPTIPAIVIFLFLLIKDSRNKSIFILIGILFSIPVTIYSIAIEPHSHLIKAIAYFVYFALLISLVLINFKKEVQRKYFTICIFLFFSFFSFSTAIYAYFKADFAQGYLHNKHNDDNIEFYEKISEYIKPDLNIYTYNVELYLLGFIDEECKQCIPNYLLKKYSLNKNLSAYVRLSNDNCNVTSIKSSKVIDTNYIKKADRTIIVFDNRNQRRKEERLLMKNQIFNIINPILPSNTERTLDTVFNNRRLIIFTKKNAK